MGRNGSIDSRVKNYPVTGTVKRYCTDLVLVAAYENEHFTQKIRLYNPLSSIWVFGTNDTCSTNEHVCYAM